MKSETGLCVKRFGFQKQSFCFVQIHRASAELTESYAFGLRLKPPQFVRYQSIFCFNHMPCFCHTPDFPHNVAFLQFI